MVWKTRITTVAMKPIPKVRATCLNSFLLIVMFLEIVDDEDSSSEVMSSIMAVAASHRPMSDIDRGSSIFLHFYYAVINVYGLCFWVYLGFLDGHRFARGFRDCACYGAYEGGAEEAYAL